MLKVLVVLLPLAGLALAQTTAFRSKSVTRTGTIRLNAGTERVFPLFGPVKEKLWAPGWEPRLTHPTDKDVAEGMVFTIDDPHGTWYWTVTQYDPALHTIAYANVTAGYMLNRIVIRCRALGANETEASVTYQHTGLNEKANQFVDSMDEKAYAAKMQHWQEAINYALQHGHPMPSPHK